MTLSSRLLYSEDSSIQLTGIYPLHILTQHKAALKYMDIEVVDKLVTCSQSPVSEVRYWIRAKHCANRILSLSALANILENCHNPLLVVYHQNWSFLNTIAKLLDSSSVIEKSIALRSIFVACITGRLRATFV
ncbi:MAG: hypothetical protein P4M11_12475 [Candidatus Pacebacteria bacterium]|nr:hypothetical protein [Candidatus Paceibacterota bacterium]